MRTILSIGSSLWNCPNAKTAAQVADLLSSFEPINRDWRNSTKVVYVAGKDHCHALSMMDIEQGAVFVKTISEAVKLRGPKDD